MPYRRSYKRKRYMPRRRRYKKRRPNPKSNRRAIRKINNMIETKHYTLVRTSVNLTGVPTTDLIQPTLNQAGVDASGVIGEKYQSIGFKINGVARQLDATAPGVGTMRIIALWVKKTPSSASVAFGTFYDQLDDASTPVSIPAYFASLRSSQSKNVKVLYDKKYDLGLKTQAFSLSAGNQTKSISFYVPIGKNTGFERDLGGGRITGGQIILFATSLIDNTVAWEYTSKFYYKDA